MSDENGALDTALRLKELIDHVELSRSDKSLAERCMRRLSQPLRLTVFGTDTRHAVSLINLMIGQPVVSPSIHRARIQFLHGDVAHARLQFRDGTQKRIEGSEFRKLFDDNPTRVRIYVDLPVLKKLSILVAAEENPVSLCADVDKTLPPADIAMWAGAKLSAPMIEAWETIPDRLRDHSYLVLSPKMDFANWKEIAQEFVEVMRVDPIAAQEAKEAAGGVDKVAFKESGGLQLVKTVKKEIELLLQAASDAAEVLLLRYEDQIPAKKAPKTPSDAPVTQGEAKSTAVPAANTPTRPSAPSVQDTEAVIDRVLSTPAREQVYSVPLGKLASRSRLLNSSAAKAPPKPTQRTVSMAIKNMPKTVTRTVSKSAPKPRPRSRRSHPAATPWSLGL